MSAAFELAIGTFNLLCFSLCADHLRNEYWERVESLQMAWQLVRDQLRDHGEEKEVVEPTLEHEILFLHSW